MSGTTKRFTEEDNTPAPLATEVAEESGASSGQWETEYEAQVKAWRAESAEAREKAERERQRWETIRESEQQQTRTESEWENVSEERGAAGGHEKEISSIESSFPSLEIVDAPPQPHREPLPPHPQEPTSVTMAIFDNTLSTRTRVTALCSSLAINLLLPFVNGVMLGFGEIFAKNIILEWLGWRTGGDQQHQRQRQRRRWT